MNAAEAITRRGMQTPRKNILSKIEGRISMSCEDRAGGITAEKCRWYSMARHRNSIVSRCSSPEYYENFVTNFRAKPRLCVRNVHRKITLQLRVISRREIIMRNKSTYSGHVWETFALLLACKPVYRNQVCAQIILHLTGVRQDSHSPKFWTCVICIGLFWNSRRKLTKLSFLLQYREECIDECYTK